MDEFLDKVVLITGAGRGAGREVALGFSSLGAAIAANDINPLNLDETVNRIHQTGGKARSYVFDIAKRMPIEAMVTQVLEQFGRIDFLVNHASVEPDAPLLGMDEWEFHRTLDVNLGGPFFTLQLVGRHFQQQGGGSIVNLISTAKAGNTGHAALSASQAGLIGLTRAAAQELEPYHIRVNSVYTASIDAGLSPSTGFDLASYYRWVAALPQAKLHGYSDLVRKVLFLCSGAASSITGQVILVNQGS